MKRGPDWDWGNQDGGPQSIGVVLDVRGWEAESFRSVACVKWKPTSTNVYRVGHKGKVHCTDFCDETLKYCRNFANFSPKVVMLYYIATMSQ